MASRNSQLTTSRRHKVGQTIITALLVVQVFFAVRVRKASFVVLPARLSRAQLATIGPEQSEALAAVGCLPLEEPRQALLHKRRQSKGVVCRVRIRVCIWVPNLLVLFILGYVPG